MPVSLPILIIIVDDDKKLVTYERKPFVARSIKCVQLCKLVVLFCYFLEDSKTGILSTLLIPGLPYSGQVYRPILCLDLNFEPEVSKERIGDLVRKV